MESSGDTMYMSDEQCDALARAAIVGNVSALETLFQNDGVRASVDATELRIPRFLSARLNGREQWYFPQWAEDHHDPHSSVIALAVRADRYEVVKWFYSPERTAIMGRTLAYLWEHTAVAAIDEANVEILELLLNCSVQLFSKVQRKHQLQEFVRRVASGRTGVWLSCPVTGVRSTQKGEYSHRDVLQILLAHGADIETNGALDILAKTGWTSLADTFVKESACVTGFFVSELSTFPVSIGGAERLLQHGIDVGVGTTTLHAAARNGSVEIVDLLVSEGFVDVDARDAQERTPLMLATALGSSGRGPHSFMTCRRTRVAKILLRAGGDITARDCTGRTAHDHATSSAFPRVAEALKKIDPLDLRSSDDNKTRRKSRTNDTYPANKCSSD